MKIFFLLPSLLLAKNLECGISQAAAASDRVVEILNAGGPNAGAELANLYLDDAIVQGGGAAATVIGKSAIASFYQQFIDANAGSQVSVVEKFHRCLAKGVFLEVATLKVISGVDEILYFQNYVGHYNKKTGEILYEHDSFGQ